MKNNKVHKDVALVTHHLPGECSGFGAVSRCCKFRLASSLRGLSQGWRTCWIDYSLPLPPVTDAEDEATK
jgi:hypothetical protein